MSEYSAVAPPQQNFNQSSAFAAALQRAKQIAAKINPNSTTGDSRSKRPLEDGAEPDAKKIAGGLAGAAAAAAQASARGAPQNQTTIPNMGGPPGVGGGPGPGQGQGPQFNEDIKVPDKMVGLIIGRGGEQITRLQAETGCKIQMAPDSAGLPERACSLSGTRDAINRAKELIMNIVQQRGRTEGLGGADLGPGMGGQDANFPPGVNMNQTMGGRNFVEIMIPGPKVGLIIGKGGETIKQLQEKSGAKMVVIQEGPNQETEKPLRISGDPQKVEYAKQLVYDLIAEKEMQNFNRRGQDNRQQQQQFNDYGGGNNEMEVLVPRPAVGVVIGKGGDMIKKIQAETGARVQFHQAKEEGPGDRRCYLSGRPQNVEQARQRIEELIESVCGNRAAGGGGRGGRERFDGRGGNRNGGGQEYGAGWDDRRPQQQPQEVSFTVPSNKCGIIIGRGGETIKQINQQSGAHCELDRRSQNQQDKTFIIRGDPEQIETAKRIISEKVQIPLNFISVGGGNNNLPTAYPGMAPQGYNPQGWGAPAYQQQWGGPHQSTDPSAAAGVQQNQNPNAVQMNPATGQADYSLQWAEYYRSLGMHREAEIIEQQAKNKTGGSTTGVPGTMATTPQTSTTTVAAPSSGAVSNGPQPDYSAQWAEYYRSLGKHKEAEAIEAQMKQKNQVGGQAPSNPTNGSGMPPGVPGQTSAMPGYPQAAAAAAYGTYQQSAGGYYGAPGQGAAPQAIQPQGQYGYSGYGYGGQASGQESQQQ